MKTPLAWRNITHNKLRSLAALSGVAFAILLIFMQLGFHDASARSAVLLTNALDFDLLLVSPQYLFVARPGSLPRTRVAQARAVEGVADVVPFHVGWGEWRSRESGLCWGMLVLAVDPARQPFRSPELNARLPLLHGADTALVDDMTRPEYGPHGPGDTAELDGHRLTVVGQYHMGTGFTANGALLTGPHTFARLFGADRLHTPSFGLVRLAPGADARQVTDRLRAALPSDVQVVTRAQLDGYEQSFWLNVKPIGIMFTSGVVVAFAVGAVILYQVLASEVQNRLGEYATLKAMGHPDRAVYMVVVQQALMFAAMGYVPALLDALLVYHLVRKYALLPIVMTPERLVFVAGLAVAMCLLSCGLAVRRLRRADPADLF